jgi:hypothetical protein
MPSFSLYIVRDTGTRSSEIGEASDQFTQDFTVVSLTICSPSRARSSFGLTRAAVAVVNGAGPPS